jgi:Domain of unknown function (DUF5658)
MGMGHTAQRGSRKEPAARQQPVVNGADGAPSCRRPGGSAAPPSRDAVRGRVTFWLLLGLWSFNICDFLLTREAMAMGRATEANGFMNYLFSMGPASALVFKFGVVSVGVLVLWRLRAHHAVLLTAALLAAVFGTLVLYQALVIATF